MEIKDVVMVSSCRTPIGDFLGSLKDFPARELDVLVGKEAIRRAGIDGEAADEIVVGQVYGAMPCPFMSVRGKSLTRFLTRKMVGKKEGLGEVP